MLIVQVEIHKSNLVLTLEDGETVIQVRVCAKPPV